MIFRCIISCIFVFLTQFALALILHFFPNYSLLTHLPLTGLVILTIAGLGRWCRKLLRVHASAPAMVFFNILFIWGVYISVIRPASSPLMGVLINGELAMLIFGLWRIKTSDPGLVSNELSELVEKTGPEVGVQSDLPRIHNFVSVRRIRYCKSCNAYIKGFDHHCPAFGSCIGQNNHFLFLVLLIGFVIVEATYMTSSSQFLTESRRTKKHRLETNISRDFVLSTMAFSLLQVLWQVVFLAWHVYCVCYNIKTDEWINWKNYPEFQFDIQSESDQTITETRFMNPYNKGIIINLKELLMRKGLPWIVCRKEMMDNLAD